jgi:phosphoglycolate phosphatase
VTTAADGILFDKDGTLFHFEASWGAWADALLEELSDGSVPLASRLAEAIGFDPASCRFVPGSPAIAGTPDEIAALMAPHLPDRNLGEVIALMNLRAADAPLVEAVPLDPLLGRLRAKGLGLGLATNDAESSARRHLDRVGVLGHFDYVAGCDSGFGAKPGPGMLLAFAAQRCLDPARVVMVGDSTHDLIAGRAAGMICVGVLTGPGGAAPLRDLADAILPDIGHLPDWLAARPA